jgi:hypothetical protein
MKDGEGMMCLPTVGQYVGQWSRNKMHGEGRYTYTDGTANKVGQWARGRFQGLNNLEREQEDQEAKA